MSIQNDCAICLRSLTELKIRAAPQIRASHDVLLPSGAVVVHDFHKECLEQYFHVSIRSGQTPICPLCRAPASVFHFINLLSDVELRELAFLQQVERDEVILHELEIQEIANQRELRERCIQNIIQGNLELVQTHLEIGITTEEDRGVFLQVAAQHGHREIVTALLTDGSIPLYARYQAIREAIRGGHLYLLEDLLPLVPLAILSVTGLSLAYLNFLSVQDKRG